MSSRTNLEVDNLTALQTPNILEESLRQASHRESSRVIKGHNAIAPGPDDSWTASTRFMLKAIRHHRSVE